VVCGANPLNMTSACRQAQRNAVFDGAANEFELSCESNLWTLSVCWIECFSHQGSKKTNNLTLFVPKRMKATTSSLEFQSWSHLNVHSREISDCNRTFVTIADINVRCMASNPGPRKALAFIASA
jgi:hypothetical protein